MLVWQALLQLLPLLRPPRNSGERVASVNKIIQRLQMTPVSRQRLKAYQTVQPQSSNMQLSIRRKDNRPYDSNRSHSSRRSLKLHHINLPLHRPCQKDGLLIWTPTRASIIIYIYQHNQHNGSSQKVPLR